MGKQPKAINQCPPSVDDSALVFLPPATGKEKDEGEAQAHNTCTESHFWGPLPTCRQSLTSHSLDSAKLGPWFFSPYSLSSATEDTPSSFNFPQARNLPPPLQSQPYFPFLAQQHLLLQGKLQIQNKPSCCSLLWWELLQPLLRKEASANMVGKKGKRIKWGGTALQQNFHPVCQVQAVELSASHSPQIPSKQTQKESVHKEKLAYRSTHKRLSVWVLW